MDSLTRRDSRFAERLFSAIVPETKRALTSVEDWAALGTYAGNVRLENQDRMLAGQFTAADSQAFRIVALSDGMGGLSHGQEAASLTLSEFLWSLTSLNGDILSRLKRAAFHANDAVFSEFRGKSGATLSAVVLTESGQAAGVNVGDSRVYGLEHNSRALEQLSTDDTLAGLAEGGAMIDRRHNSAALLQYVGMGDELDPHVLLPTAFLNKEFIVLSTDGVHWVGNKLLELIVQNAGDHTQCVRRLLQLAEMTGAKDNATLAVINHLAGGHLALHDSSADIEVELWTPGGKTVLLLETKFSSRSSVNEKRDPWPSPEERIGGAPPPPSVTKPNAAPKKRRVKKKARSPEAQADLPIERPELVIEFGSPKREEDETSR
ncbi:MAG: PP2C family protein-serine/threonine phosphatase [Allosphingosinicella sp.]